MNRTHHIQELLEGFHVIQQKMLEKHKPMIGMSQITFSQWRVIEIVDRVGKASIKEIHTKLGITSSAATQLVNELVKKKYVIRQIDPEDKRISSIVLSIQMSKLFKRLKDENLDRTIELFQALSDQEFIEYMNLNKKIIKNIYAKN